MGITGNSMQCPATRLQATIVGTSGKNTLQTIKVFTNHN